ncbi:MAG TPA: hypothetical protein VEH84_14100, partial [Alphaproteobacteria bacterium]|nr:hypothetical protein [Alphaproteobacteria bacterium]
MSMRKFLTLSLVAGGLVSVALTSGAALAQALPANLQAAIQAAAGLRGGDLAARVQALVAANPQYAA